MFSKCANELLKISNELADIAAAGAVLAWDQETYMPPAGAGVRAMQLSTLAGIYHEKLTDPKVGALLRSMSRATKGRLNGFDKALLREVKREYDKAIKLPTKLVQEISEATALAFDCWLTAKKDGSFGKFAPDLERVLKLKVAAAGLLATTGQSIYDAMLDDHEPGLTEAEVERVFGGVRSDIVRLGAELAKLTGGADENIKNKGYDLKKQWAYGITILEKMGYDLAAGRQDRSAHPFTTNFGVSDVRITTWENEKDLRPALFATIHEAGHALYEQGVDKRLERTHLAGGQGLVMHESQSRMWENLVGRSQEFWDHHYTYLQREFPGQLGRVTEKGFVRAVNVVRPSLVRVEADEVTYGLHIMLRFEIEKELVRGRTKVKDLPGVWRQKMKDLLGVVPENDREGVLQDVHWAHGSFGYFPTYLLGTMAAAQIWHVVPEETKNLRGGDLKGLREWLRENIHKHGRLYTPKELLIRVTGEELNPRFFVRYLENKFRKLYN